ncbi:MAG: GNAT family N-acetyltransferase [Rhodospirillales bacterium]|nr:MAG: GNAT family N-acetyltransferase [Rhodospirillales bacterium]
MTGGDPAAPAAGGAMAALPLETARLLLRPYREADTPYIVELLNDPVMADFLMVTPQPFVAFDARQLVKAAWRRLTTGRGFDLMIVSKDGERPLGGVGVGLHDEGARAELGFWIGRGDWGQGYATEAASRMIEFARDSLGVARITATAAAGNAASRRVLDKLGFVETGRGERKVASTGEMRPVLLLELAGTRDR